ncbi:MAG: 16S rRNA (adenine(1518)-N(6)/adenine(1519)-N(6))-dimethyltransferase RsmA [bacterium]|nr:16S rRNA (adenine(1518)-N(6)/adenine(1519)-N(6))-dimethyltransferase RsmA [bacterium]
MKKQASQTGFPQDFRPKKQLGQHFLRQKSVLNKIIAAAELEKTDLVLEIGPGEGVLTEALAITARRVVAVEKDHRLIPILKKKFEDIKNVKIVEGDILQLLKTRRLKLEARRYKLVANLPYYAATHIIRLFLESTRPPKLMVLMVQKEVAQRMCPAKPSVKAAGRGAKPKMSLLAISVQFYAEPKIINYVSKNAFWPKPKVDSAILRIAPLMDADKRRIDADTFFKIAKAGFSQPRKQLLNNFATGLKLSKKEVAAWLEKNNISPSQRAQNLSLDDWLKLTKLFK